VQVAADALEELTERTEALTARARAHQLIVDEMTKPTDDSLLDAYNALAKAVRSEATERGWTI